MSIPIRHEDEDETFPVPDPPPHGGHTSRRVEESDDNFPVPDPPPHSGF